MANIKSQIKRNRQNEKRRLRNRVYRGAARTAVKNARSAITTGDPESSKQALLAAISQLDQAAQKGVLHKNNAARRKSRLMKEFARMQPAPAKVEAAPKIEEPVVEAKPKKASSRAAAAKEVKAQAKPKAEPKAKAVAKPKAEAKPKAAPKTKAAPKKTAAKTTKK